jgi:DNA polymerase-3 subunit beta
MKISVLPGALASALAVATSTIASRNPVNPIFGCVLLEATPDGGLVVSGTNLESRSSHTVQAEVIEAGAVALPPDALRAFLEAVPGSEAITLTVNAAHKAEMVSGKTRSRVAGHDPEQFPMPPSFDDPAVDVTIGAETLRLLVGSVGYAIAPDDSRPVLSGVLLRIKDGRLTAAAADGFRLATRSVEIEDAPDLDVIPHGKTLIRAAGMLDKAMSARLLVDANRSMLKIDTEAGVWSMKLIDDDFPDFWRIVPKNAPTVVTLDRSDLQRAMRLIRTVMEEVTEKGRTYRTVMARLTVTAESLDIQARGKDGDQEAEVSIAADLERGQGMAITFNGAYFRDAIEAIDADRITLELSGPASPALLKPRGEPRDHIHVCMPMHDARKSS